ncbi:salt stress protein, Slr1339 family [Anabaena sp. WFMT]|uniref:salt stress protein, Slr1339 family n=1 Tax=Anabaena sp. WFMT TaxID=3449730 RepID=UPI003F22AA3B
MDSIDKLLAELQAEYLEAKPQPQQQITPPKPFIYSSAKSNSLIDNLLSEVKTDFLEKDAAEELKQKQELEQEKSRQEQLKAKQLETLKKRAKEWLSKLDPFSPEGLWFERFAEAYPSKLEAAIEYLQTSQ